MMRITAKLMSHDQKFIAVKKAHFTYTEHTKQTILLGVHFCNYLIAIVLYFWCYFASPFFILNYTTLRDLLTTERE